MGDKKYVEVKASRNEKKYNLETVKGGWIVVVKMDHGQSLARLDDILLIELREDGSRAGRASNVKGRHFDFEHCISDHNLQLAGVPCDFRDPADVDALDEDIGDEIQNWINIHHGRLAGGLDEGPEEGPESDPN